MPMPGHTALSSKANFGLSDWSYWSSFYVRDVHACISHQIYTKLKTAYSDPLDAIEMTMVKTKTKDNSNENKIGKSNKTQPFNMQTETR